MAYLCYLQMGPARLIRRQTVRPKHSLRLRILEFHQDIQLEARHLKVPARNLSIETRSTAYPAEAHELHYKPHDSPRRVPSTSKAERIRLTMRSHSNVNHRASNRMSSH